MFIRFDVIHERDGQTNRRTLHDSKDPVYASHRAVKTATAKDARGLLYFAASYTAIRCTGCGKININNLTGTYRVEACGEGFWIHIQSQSHEAIPILVPSSMDFHSHSQTEFQFPIKKIPIYRNFYLPYVSTEVYIGCCYLSVRLQISRRRWHRSA